MEKYKTNYLLIYLLLISILTCARNTEKIFRVQQGAFRATITETGELQAVNSSLVTMPSFDWDYGEPKIAALGDEGKIVKKGDIVGQIDTSGVVRHLGQKKADLEIAKADLQKLNAQIDSKMKQLSAELESAEAALRTAAIDTQRVKFEASAIREISRLNFKIAEIAYQKARKKISNAQKVNEEEKQIQQEKIKQIISAIEKAKWTISNFTLRAPADGLIEHRKRGWRGEKVRVGDQLWMGEPIIGLPDLSSMKVLSSVNETDIDKIQINQQVSVRLDAFPKIAFAGNVIKVGKTCRKKDNESKIKLFDLEIMIKKPDAILRPGMTVSCEILIAELDQALYVDHACILQKENKYYVMIKNGGATRQVEIKLGPRNSKSVVITGKVKAGDRILIPHA